MVCRPAIRIEILNKEETMENTIIITNSHPHGFCFACDTISNEQVFIPIHVAEGYTLKPGDKIKALLVPNFADKSARGTPWQAVRLYSEKDVPINQVVEVRDAEHLNAFYDGVIDDEVMKLIKTGGYFSTEEIADHLDVDHNLAADMARKHFVAGRIVMADVFMSGKDEPAMTLWALNAAEFFLP